MRSVDLRSDQRQHTLAGRDERIARTELVFAAKSTDDFKTIADYIRVLKAV